MISSISELSNLWIRRRARPEADALRAIEGLTPAVVITGASRGIGLALAKRFARDGSRRALVLIARDMDALEAAAQQVADESGARTVLLALDITIPDAAAHIDKALLEAGLYLDVLVNNAGIGLSGTFAEKDLSEIEKLISLNITAATRLMHSALSPMLARGRGGILNVGSLGGLVPGPNQAAYYASKSYLCSLTEAVAHEVRGRGVRISVVAPGPVDTGFHRDMQAENALYRTIVPAMSADAVARSAYRGYMLGLTVVVPGVLPSLAGLAVSVLPHTITVPIVGTLLATGKRGSESRSL